MRTPLLVIAATVMLCGLAQVDAIPPCEGDNQTLHLVDDTMIDAPRELAIEGSTAIIFQNDRSIGDTFRLRFFTRADGVWSEDVDATIYDLPVQGSGFWYPNQIMDISGDTAIVSTMSGAPASGEILILQRQGPENIWAVSQTLPALGSEDNFHGLYVAIDQDVIVISATHEGDDGNGDSGAVYVYRQNDQAWFIEDILEPEITTEVFGYGVAVEGDTIIAGGWGNKSSCTVFDYNGSAWIETGLLAGSGRHIGLSNNRAMIGDTIHVRNSDGTWTLEQQLELPEELTRFWNYGDAQIDNDVVVMAAIAQNVDGTDIDRYYALVYQHDGTQWALQTAIEILETSSPYALPTCMGVSEGQVAVGLVDLESATPFYFDQLLIHTLPCDVDITCDGQIGVDDLLMVIASWGSDDPDADIFEDGTVDVNDLLLVISAWGPCP